MSDIDLTPPETLQENLAYRAAVRQWALTSSANRQWLMDRCRDDFFFFVKTFCWLLEPRAIESKDSIIPFLPWPHQTPIIETLLENFGKRDVIIEKSRGEGASFLNLAIFMHQWLFVPHSILGFVSRNEEQMDSLADPSSLGAKIDFMLTRLPAWMSGTTGNDYERNVARHTWTRKDNGSVLAGYATTRNLAAGGRCKALLIDEFGRFPRNIDEDVLAACGPVTNCRIFCSTFDGAHGAFYRICREQSNALHLVLDWKQNPTRNADLFRVDRRHSRLLAPDSDESVLEGTYAREFFAKHAVSLVQNGFDLDNKKRLWSPWYVNECLRAGSNARMIAQELDHDPTGSSSSFFMTSIIEPLLSHCQQPTHCGDILISQKTLTVTGFSKSPAGAMRLWVPLDSQKQPPSGHYIVGADIASGQGGAWSSNSTLSVVDRETGKKVASFASPVLRPEPFAEHAIAVCRWFSADGDEPAFLIWEANGHGTAFGARILDSDFRNFHWRIPWDSSKHKQSKKPGWWTSPDSKRSLLSKYRHALSEGYFDNPCELSLRECLNYAELPGGKIEFQGGPSASEDPSNAGAAHGDRCIADALANWALEELGGGAMSQIKTASKKKEDVLTPPRGSFAFRAGDRKRSAELAKANRW